MGDAAENTLELVSVTADRLRLAQMDFAAEPPEQRRAYLMHELRGALDLLDQDARRPFLERLRTRFPKWDGSTPPPAAATAPVTTKPAVPPPPPPPPPEPKDAMSLAMRLADLARALPEDQRRAI